MGTGTLVRTESEDGWQLEGMVFEPATALPQGWVVILIHGVAGRFYSRTLAGTAMRLAQAGFIAVSGNVRGHDYGALITHRDGALRLQGGAYEDLRDAPLDVAGWIGWAQAHWPDRPIGLFGHSLGGWKVAHYQSVRRDPAVQRLFLASPLFHPSRWWNSEAAGRAQTLVAAGRGQELIPGLASRIGLVSAHTVVSRSPEFWPHTLPELLRQAGVPAVISYGTVNDIQEPEQVAAFAPDFPVHLIEGADHHYHQRLDTLADKVVMALGAV